MNKGTSWLIIGAMAAAVCVVSAGLNHAQSAGTDRRGTRVAVVDLVQVFNDFEQTRVLNEKMREHRIRLSEEADRRMQEINQEQAALEALNPNAPAFINLRRKIRDEMFNFRVWEMIEQDNLTETHRRWVKRTYEMITEEIARVAQRKGFDMVMTTEELDLDVQDTKTLVQQLINRKVIYSDPSFDLTREVLSNLNDSFAQAGGAHSIDFAR